MSIFNNGPMLGGSYSINPNTLNDFSRVQFQNTGYNVGSCSAKLFLFTPQAIPFQVARPFVYQFTPDFIDTIKDQRSLTEAVGPNGRPSDAVLKAILPSSDGMVLNTNTMQNMWSFVLIIDTGNEMIGSIMKPGIRKVAIGYVADEPGTFDMVGNFVPNPNAILMFTHSSTLFVRRSAGPMTMCDGLTVYNSQDVDYANETTAMMFNDKVMLGTPKEIMSLAREQQNNPSSIADYSSIDLGIVKQGVNDVKAIDNSIKAPRHQLSDIMSAIDNGIDATVTEEPIYSRFTNNDDMYTPPNERAINTCINNMPSSIGLQFNTSLDTTKPTSLGEITTMFPNIYIAPMRVKTNNGYGWDTSNQAALNSSGQVAPIMSIRNQLSYLASVTAQSICGQLGISQVAFSYMSLDGDGIVPGHREAFNIANFDLIVPRVTEVQKLVAERLKQLLDDQLFDIIRALAGPYEIHALINMGGDILINLKLYNFPDPEDGTYYQTSARFGAMMNPMVGGIDVINNNVLQLSNMTQTLVGHNFNAANNFGGTSMFDSGVGMMPSAF